MNPTMLQGFHWYSEGNGELYKQMKNESDHLVELGISAVWFPPAYKSAGGGYSVGYDPYDLFDLGEFEQKGTVSTKYGNKKQYLDCTKALQEKGILFLKSTASVEGKNGISL